MRKSVVLAGKIQAGYIQHQQWSLKALVSIRQVGNQVNKVIEQQIKEEEIWDNFYSEFSEAMYVDPAESTPDETN